MEQFAKRLRKRAEELGISNAEAARRTGLSERRYAHYVKGQREPDLATLVRIADSLETTPNELLGLLAEQKKTRRSVLLERLNAAANQLSERNLEMIVLQTEAIARVRGN
jgi:transcriptional regulator with XRE-family HTH domain